MSPILLTLDFSHQNIFACRDGKHYRFCYLLRIEPWHIFYQVIVIGTGRCQNVVFHQARTYVLKLNIFHQLLWSGTVNYFKFDSYYFHTVTLVLISKNITSCRMHSVIAVNANLQAGYMPFIGLVPGTHVLTLCPKILVKNVNDIQLHNLLYHYCMIDCNLYLLMLTT